MPVQTGDYVVIRDYQTLFQQQVLNTYTLRIASFTGASTYQNMLEAFEQTVVAAVTPLQVPDLVHTRLEVDNLTNGLEFAAVDISVPGTSTPTDPSPPMVAVSIRMTRATKITRNGYKRYAGLHEGQYSEGVLNAGALTPWQANVANLIGAPFGYTSGTIYSFGFEPVIIGRDTATGAYDLSRVNEVTGAVVQPNVTTQNTRKYGRGA